jgi:hypothetical protein
MPIRTTCPECQAVYDLADHLGGKRVLCAECRCAIEVPSPDAVQVQQPSPVPPRKEERKEDDDRPRRRRRLDWDDEEDRLRRRPRPKTSGALVVGLVVGGVLVFGCGLCGLVGLLRSSSNPQQRPPMALAPPPLNPPFVQPPDAGLPEVRQGDALAKQGREKEAEKAFREAVRRNPDSAWAHCKLGLHLQEQGRFAEALVELRRGHDLGMGMPGWNQPSAEWVAYCEHLIDMDKRFPAILAGDAEPADDTEGVEYVTFSVVYKHRPATAARLAAATLAGDPRLAPEQYDLCLYNGACGAALAAAGRGDDAKGLPDKVVVMLRRQALRWLREDLKRYEQEAPIGGGVLMNVRRMLAHWQVDDDLSTVRDRVALDRLPEDERRAWQGLWKDVAVLRQKVGAAR